MYDEPGWPRWIKTRRKPSTWGVAAVSHDKSAEIEDKMISQQFPKGNMRFCGSERHTTSVGDTDSFPFSDDFIVILTFIHEFAEARSSPELRSTNKDKPRIETALIKFDFHLSYLACSALLG